MRLSHRIRGRIAIRYRVCVVRRFDDDARGDDGRLARRASGDEIVAE